MHNAFALQLLIAKALDENGRKLFNAGEIDVLKNEVKDSDLQSLMLAVNNSEEEETIDPKELACQLKRDNLMMLQFGVAKELGKVFQEIRNMTLDELIGGVHILNI